MADLPTPDSADTAHAPVAGPTAPARRSTSLSRDDWWRDAVIYQIYPRSFADSDGDGMGDLPGITSRLDHVARLGVDAVWLSPFYRSPQADAGYDVADYRDVDPLFGTLDDAEAMLERAHELGLRVIVDLVPNHTSDQHAWFRAALAAGPGSPERERYWFRDGKVDPETGEVDPEQAPTNWRSVFGGPAWSRVRDRADALGSPWEDDAQWYLHLFDPGQPDLDWEHPEVRDEFRDVLRFWLDRGVDGFRVDVAHGLVKDRALPDYDAGVRMVSGTEDEERRPEPMFDQDGVHEIYQEWRSVLEEYDHSPILVAEAWVEPPSRLVRYVRPDEMHQAFNFVFLSAPWTTQAKREAITTSLDAHAGVDAPATWVMSNHDVVRHVTRLGLDVAHTGKGPNGLFPDDPQPDAELGSRRARAATLLMLALPGSAYLYQGEELGLPEHTELPADVRQDPAFERMNREEAGRDGCRVPMPWEAGRPGLGFGPSGRTWLPQPDEYAKVAVSEQETDLDSTLAMYRTALDLRAEYHLGGGTWEWRAEHEIVAVNSGVRGDGGVGAAGAGAAEAGAAGAEDGRGAGAGAGSGAGAGRADVLVATAIERPIALPEGWSVILASAPIDDPRQLPVDTTAWLVRD